MTDMGQKPTRGETGLVGAVLGARRFYKIEHLSRAREALADSE